jgi:hypothetical protein
MFSIERAVCICLYMYIYLYELRRYDYIIYLHMKVSDFSVSLLCLSMYVAATRILSSVRNNGL